MRGRGRKEDSEGQGKYKGKRREVSDGKGKNEGKKEVGGDRLKDIKWEGEKSRGKKAE